MTQRARGGESLVEVVFAIALVTIAIGGILSILVQGVAMEQDADRMYVAVNLCKNRLELIRQVRADYSFLSLEQLAEDDTIVDRNGTADLNGDYLRTTEIDADYETHLARVVITVSYRRMGLFTSPAMELVTFVSEYT